MSILDPFASTKWPILSVLFCIVLSFITIHGHVSHYNRPSLQKRVVRIILLVPLYAVQALLSLPLEGASLLLDSIRDTYEAYALYQFFALCVSYLGGERLVLDTLQTKTYQTHVWPVDRLFSPMYVAHPRYFRSIQRGVLQFALIKPLMGLLSLCIYVFFGLSPESQSLFSPNNPFAYISLINNISISVSLYCLMLFYELVCGELAEHRPLLKFLCLKLVIFFSFWQNFGLSILTHFEAVENGTYIQNYLICIEMAAAAIAHSFAFNYREFLPRPNDLHADRLNTHPAAATQHPPFYAVSPISHEEYIVLSSPSLHAESSTSNSSMSSPLSQHTQNSQNTPTGGATPAAAVGNTSNLAKTSQHPPRTNPEAYTNPHRAIDDILDFSDIITDARMSFNVLPPTTVRQHSDYVWGRRPGLDTNTSNSDTSPVQGPNLKWM